MEDIYSKFVILSLHCAFFAGRSIQLGRLRGGPQSWLLYCWQGNAQCVCVCARVCLQLRVSFCVRRLRLVGWRPGFTRRFSYFTLKLSSWSLLLCWRSLPIHLQKCPGTQRSRSSCCTRHFCCLFIVGVLILDLFGLWQAFIPPADPVHEHFSEVPLWHEVLRNFFLNLVLPVRWRIRCPLKTLDRRARRFICFCCCSMGGASAVSVSSLDLYEWLQ